MPGAYSLDVGDGTYRESGHGSGTGDFHAVNYGGAAGAPVLEGGVHRGIRANEGGATSLQKIDVRQIGMFGISTSADVTVQGRCTEGCAAPAGNDSTPGHSLTGMVVEVAERWNLEGLDEDGIRSLKDVLAKRVMLAEFQMAMVFRSSAGVAHGRESGLSRRQV
jgi:hypothetical protein